MIYEMNYILNGGYEIKCSNCYDPRSYEHNFGNCAEKPEKSGLQR